MKNYVLGLGVVGAFVFAAACSLSTNGTCQENGTCPETAGQDGGDERDAADADSSAPVPEGCDPNAEPKNSPKCVVNDYGVFVDGTTGNDSNAGTKESPVKTIGAALGKLGGKPRVYVCEGTYAEHVKLSSAVSLYGGFSCTGFAATEAKPKIAPADAGYALQIEKVAGAVVIADLAFESIAGTEASPSSITAFVSDSANVTFKRVSLTAHDGADGKPGAAGTKGTLTSAMPTANTFDGNKGDATNGGAPQICTCSTGGTSKGGAGGVKGGDGSAGKEDQMSPDPTNATGAGQTEADCFSGGVSARPGSNAPAASPAASVSKLGEVQVSGWIPSAGIVGPNGTPGQGGGGGGGSGGGGGGGGCGGCGGSGGGGGGGGGASVALVSVGASAVTLVDSTLTAEKAGNGGTGGAGGEGGTGGVKGGNGGAACLGANGGKGGNGGAGSGGAGGVSAGVLYSGVKPTLQNTTITPGTKGAKGVGGAAGVNDGPEGQSGDVIEVN
ncbi:Glycine-rich cell wall structural protein precursor [Labilithrix luteola]|uniref:Glycine-rich cell wall structural protein n=1 Tax=Labilithrix luteola TaxID=1391654 RepID=A0A0K1PMX8_9BACT|nr:hypothetical protein [Labilithrix luteola]AKU94741.1 Glycine-rich cell wall structural protein precursor [Labilithrix luteola]